MTRSSMKPWAHMARHLMALSVALLLLTEVSSFVVHPHVTTPLSASSSSAIFGKKAKRKGAAAKNNRQPPQEKQSVKDARFDAQTRQFMFSIVGLNKMLPDKSKQILKNINLAFYPGAKVSIGFCVIDCLQNLHAAFFSGPLTHSNFLPSRNARLVSSVPTDLVSEELGWGNHDTAP